MLQVADTLAKTFSEKQYQYANFSDCSLCRTLLWSWLRRMEHITLILKSLHWLPIRQQVT